MISRGKILHWSSGGEEEETDTDSGTVTATLGDFFLWREQDAIILSKQGFSKSDTIPPSDKNH